MKVSWLPESASKPRPMTLRIVPATIQGRRRPHRVTVRSLNQPTRMGVRRAKTPPAAVTRPMSRSASRPAMRVAPTGMSAM